MTDISIPMITSPVPGISLDLANLLITAIKTRRKHLSKSSSSEDAGRLQTLKESADDATTAFISQLRKDVEAAKWKQPTKPIEKPYIINSATHSLDFLLSNVSEANNSFHLRRAALILCKEILQRSSDARAHLDSGTILLDFVSAIQRVNREYVANNAELSPQCMFQQDAIELMRYLSEKYGTFYPKYIVANRLTGEISTVTFAAGTNDDHPQRLDMISLRRERNLALKKGSKACDVLERMIDRADCCFGILVPRYGGFMHDTMRDGTEQLNRCDAKSEDVASKACLGYANNGTSDIDDDNSILWEEGDADGNSNQDQNCTEEAIPSAAECDSRTEDTTNDHDTAVSLTLDVMQRSGLLQEGGLSVELGASVQNSSIESDTNGDAQANLKKIVQDLSSRRLPRLSRWINALSHADGMEERAVSDMTRIGDGPVSLVLLSEEKRAIRGPLLKRMLKVRSDIETVIQSANVIVALEETTKQTNNERPATTPNTSQGPNASATIQETSKKRTWLSSIVVAGKPTAKKKTKSSKFKVIYHKK